MLNMTMTHWTGHFIAAFEQHAAPHELMASLHGIRIDDLADH